MEKELEILPVKAMILVREEEGCLPLEVQERVGLVVVPLRPLLEERLEKEVLV